MNEADPAVLEAPSRDIAEPTARDEPARVSPTLKLALRVVVTAAILALLFWQVRWADVWRLAQSLDWRVFLVVCIVWAPTQYLQFTKWKILARESGAEVSRGDIRRAYWVGFTLGLITPGRVGQMGRGLALHNCSLSRAIAASVLDRAYAAFVINGLGLISLVVLPFLGWTPPLALPGPVVKIILITAGLILLGLGVFPGAVRGPLGWIARRLPLREKTEQALDVVSSTGPKRGLILLALTSAGTATSLFQFVLLIRALGGNVPYLAGMLAGLLTFFVKGALPISIGSLGVGEWTAMYCFRGLGVEPSVAVAASLLLFTINVFLPSMIGLPFLNTLRVPVWSKSGRTA